MKSIARLTIILLLTTLVGFATLAASTTSAEAATKKCYSVRGKGDAQSHLVCYRLLRHLRKDYKVGYRDSLINRTSRTASLQCEASQSKTFTYGGSITVGAEAKAWIFAKVSASVTVSVSKSLSSGHASRTGVSVPAHTTVYCDRVVYRERFSVCKTSIWYGKESSCKVFTFWAPSRRGWVLRDA